MLSSYVRARLLPIVVADRYVYLFTLPYHIRKSDRKHFPTLKSTLHHRSSLAPLKCAKLAHASGLACYRNYCASAIVKRSDPTSFNSRHVVVLRFIPDYSLRSIRFDSFAIYYKYISDYNRTTNSLSKLRRSIHGPINTY